MSENADTMKGRIKEAAGDPTDDEDLERAGKLDQATPGHPRPANR